MTLHLTIQRNLFPFAISLKLYSGAGIHSCVKGAKRLTVNHPTSNKHSVSLNCHARSSLERHVISVATEFYKWLVFRKFDLLSLSPSLFLKIKILRNSLPIPKAEKNGVAKIVGSNSCFLL